MEGPRQKVDRQTIETVTLRSDGLREEPFLASLAAEAPPVLRLAVAVDSAVQPETSRR